MCTGPLVGMKESAGISEGERGCIVFGGWEKKKRLLVKFNEWFHMQGTVYGPF